MFGKPGTTMLMAAAVIAAVFVANIIVGATGGPVFLSDVGEMLTLFAACICFVIAFLQREQFEKSTQETIGTEADQGGQTE